MSNFTPLVTKEYEFEGDTVTVTFRRLKRKHMLQALPAMNRLSELDVNETEINNKTELVNDFIGSIIDAIPEYVETFSGLADSEGNPIGIETVINDFYFLKLATFISMDMVKSSTPKMEGNL
jgi:hypothetical protein